MRFGRHCNLIWTSALCLEKILLLHMHSPTICHKISCCSDFSVLRMQKQGKSQLSMQITILASIKPSMGRNKDNCSFMSLGKKPAPGIFNLLERGHVWPARKSSTCQILLIWCLWCFWVSFRPIIKVLQHMLRFKYRSVSLASTALLKCFKLWKCWSTSPNWSGKYW